MGLARTLRWAPCRVRARTGCRRRKHRAATVSTCATRHGRGCRIGWSARRRIAARRPARNPRRRRPARGTAPAVRICVPIPQRRARASRVDRGPSSTRWVGGCLRGGGGDRVGEPDGRGELRGPVVGVHVGAVDDPPCRVETSGIFASRGVTAPAMSRKAACAGAMSGEWNACDTASGVTLAPRAASAPVMRSTASAGPDTTVDRGPFTAAIAARRFRRHQGATSSAGTSTALIAPPAGSCCINSATRDDESCRLVEGQYLGEHRRSELAHAVADEERRFDPEFEQRRAERIRHGEQSRLGVPGVINGGAVGEHQVEQPAGCVEGGVDRGGRAVRWARYGGQVRTGHASCRGIGHPDRCTAARPAREPPR